MCCSCRGSGGVCGAAAAYYRPLSAPSLVTAEFKGFFRLGRAVRVVIPAGVLHLFVVYGCHGAEQDPDMLALTIGCCVMVIGDFSAELGVDVVQLKAGAGRFVDPGLVFSVGAGARSLSLLVPMLLLQLGPVRK